MGWGEEDLQYEEDQDEYWDYDEGAEEIDEKPHMQIQHLIANCLEPTVREAFFQVGWVLSACLLFRLVNKQAKLKPKSGHILSFILGQLALISIVGWNAVWTVLVGVAGYVMVNKCGGHQGIGMAQAATMLLVGYLVAREYLIVGPEMWEQVRGIQMILVMKILSICFDLGLGTMKTVPSFVEYLGYMFCPANVVFGPWVPFGMYCQLFDVQQNVQRLGWVWPAFSIAVCSLVSLVVSSCLTFWLFLGVKSRWIVAYRDAMSVRFSHYFVSYLSELTCVLTGFPNDSAISVAEPWRIELPRSLVDVVVYWNKPMHRWLRNYIFRPTLQRGTFQAVLWTFIVSSMLHGLNFGLTMVLLTLGFYTYAEHTLREKLSNIFDACIGSRRCPPNCSHKYKAEHPAVVAVNIGLFGVLAVFNLAYVGILISKDDEDSLSLLDTIDRDIKKWSDLGYFSHWMMLVIYLTSATI